MISVEIRRFSLITNNQFRQAILAFIIIALPSFFITGNYIVADAPVPKEGMEENPFPDEPLSQGILMIVIDGGRMDMMSDDRYMPKLNERVKEGAYLEIETNPITMTASCVKEIATGVPSRPNEGLKGIYTLEKIEL